MSDGGVVRSDSIIEVHSDVIEAVGDESHDGDEPGGGTRSALRHAPFIEPVGCAEGVQRDSIRVYS